MSRLRRFALVAFLVPLAPSPSARADGHWRLRAREDFETGRLNLADGQGNMAYRGFVSAFDVFHEEPYRLLYGLAVQRGHLSRVARTEGIALTAVGAEVKHFPLAGEPWFWRGGVQAAGLDPHDSGGDFWTYGATLDTGFELPLRRLGVAPELGVRYDLGTRGKKLYDFYAGLGVHFYIFKGDPRPADALRAARR